MGQYEVTQGEYREIMGANPSSFTGNDRLPVENVTWTQAVDYCSKLTTREQNANRLPAGHVYRLPTEAEWEYACRAGTTTRFGFGDDPDYNLLRGFAWFNSNSGNQTHTVGEKAPNRWGLFDMHGNVWEWCGDWYGSYQGGSLTDPKGARTGSVGVGRGGSWGSAGQGCRSAWRGYSPSARNGYLGFRVVLAPGQ
ncbi:MAG: formylglycine-generating enzyme family protein [Verrucomicrobia bacterium]|nr:formylglycine-generating enzyme family protein [Verrucomicrobiota bacterium]